jgi:alpha-L-rhamnosidase
VAGENHFRIAPIPGGTFTFAEASYASLYGKVRSRWEKTENGFCLNLDIPPNTSAEIQLPGGKIRAVAAGTHRFEWQPGVV